MVTLSYLVAVFASYIALDFTGRLRDVGNTQAVSLLWLTGGAVAMGAGIWSMHFIGMLAFSMPSMPMAYDTFWTAVSMLVAIFASTFALFLLKRKIINWTHMMLGGVILGFAIASMHYVGMHAMQISMKIHYLPGLFTLSIIIAVIASEAALWLAIKSNQVVMSMRFRLKIVSALIMGAAICGMHYTGMAAAIFTALPTLPEIEHALNPQFLSIAIAIVVFCILTIAVFASTYKEAKNQQLLATARQAGMAEMAASVLHNVGNVLNSVNISASFIAEKIINSHVNELKNVSKLMNDHEVDFSNFILNDARGKQLPKYITMLAAQWKSDQDTLIKEALMLTENINHIKSIISMQQNLSRISSLEQIISIGNVVDEAILITGISTSNKVIQIEKNYTTTEPILIDKVKFLQILVNLINNAKDSLSVFENPDKKIVLAVNLPENDRFEVKVSDNGMGIQASNMIKIFSYGFTTKEKGHGFGLHSSAIAAKEMGGLLSVTSEGLNQGATFTLELPYKLPDK